MKLIRKITKKEDKVITSKDAAKERLHLVLMQDRANVSADFLELMKQEIIEVIKKYIDVDETAIDVRLTNKDNGDGTKGAPALYANIPIVNIKDEVRQSGQANTQITPHNTQDSNVEQTKDGESKKQTKDKKANKVEEKSIEDNIETQETEVIHETQEEQDEKIVVQNTEN